MARSAQDLLAYMKRRIPAPEVTRRTKTGYRVVTLKGAERKRFEARELQAAIEARGVSKPEAVRLAMATKSKLLFDYTRKYDGATAEYQASPYEKGPNRAGRTVLWATERMHGAGQIHGFLWNRIRNVRPQTLTKFRPRWAVQEDTV